VSGFVGFDTGSELSSLAQSSVEECADGELRRVMKGMRKRDAVTKLKVRSMINSIHHHFSHYLSTFR